MFFEGHDGVRKLNECRVGPEKIRWIAEWSGERGLQKYT